MRGKTTKRLRCAVPLAPFALLALALLAPSHAAAQQARHQVAWSGIWPGEAYAMLGAEGARPLGGGECVPGGPPCGVAEWALLAGVYGGAVTERVPLSLLVQAGVERKLTADLGLALIGFWLAHPLQAGPALRLDALDVGAVKVGWGWGDRDGLFVALEIASALLTDVAMD